MIRYSNFENSRKFGRGGGSKNTREAQEEVKMIKPERQHKCQHKDTP